ncbi:MAG TPA: TlpA disulfide reductase family protein [Candidatus Limnocylindrales bacterium]|nr:TlpA disulfide reductase family protein [Candidatus Limnocylindrales bacterium]
MTKYFIAILLVAAVGLTGILIGITAVHARHFAEPAPVAAAARAEAPAPRALSDDPDARVVRFASNPIAAPPFLVADIDGNVISTAEWHGKVVLLNFWATWCPPCREEIPEMIELASRYKDRLQVIGVSMDDGSVDDVKAFVKEEGMNYPVVMWSPEIVREYGGVPALPTSFVINPAGRVVQKHVGLFSIDTYETEIRALLGLPVNARVETFEDTGQIFLKNVALATELPGVDFKGLNAEQKKAALKRLNSETCSCGCGLTLAQCRMNDTSCPISRKLAEQVVKDVLAGKPAPQPGAPLPQ